MEKEGFSITNIDIVSGVPCCDVKLVIEGAVVWQRQGVSFEEVRELMAKTKENCGSVVKHLDSIKNPHHSKLWGIF